MKQLGLSSVLGNMQPGCAKHIFLDVIMKNTDKKYLNNLLTKCLQDFLNRHAKNLDQISLSDIFLFSEEWMKQNVNYLEYPTPYCEGTTNFKNEDVAPHIFLDIIHNKNHAT